MEDKEKNLQAEIASALYNSFLSSQVRREVQNKDYIYDAIKLQIQNLFYLENHHPQEGADKLSILYAKILANITNDEVVLDRKNYQPAVDTLVDDYHSLLTTIANIIKVDRTVISRAQNITAQKIESLQSDIKTLNNFDDGEAEANDHNISKANHNPANNFAGSAKSETRDEAVIPSTAPNMNFSQLQQTGNLPTHPAQNPNFYPYLTKPKQMPILKKVLAGTLLFLLILTIIRLGLAYGVTGNVVVVKGNAAEYLNWGKITVPIWEIPMAVLLYGVFIYMFLKPSRYHREDYRISLFVLVLMILWIGYTVITTVYALSGTGIKALLTNTLQDKQELDEGAVAAVQALSEYKTYLIFSIIASVAASVPITVVLMMLILNPRLDKEKIMRANNEYQNAVAAALTGKTYQMDPSLFEEELVKNKKKNNPNDGIKKSPFSAGSSQ